MSKDKFADYLQHGTGRWHTRALTDKSLQSKDMPESDTNVTLATYGDAVLKLALCELLLDRVEELTIEKAKYESDVSLVQIAEHYHLLEYLHFAKNNPQIPQDYRYYKVQHGFSQSKKEKIRKFNRRNHFQLIEHLRSVL